VNALLSRLKRCCRLYCSVATIYREKKEREGEGNTELLISKEGREGEPGPRSSAFASIPSSSRSEGKKKRGGSRRHSAREGKEGGRARRRENGRLLICSLSPKIAVARNGGEGKGTASRRSRQALEIASPHCEEKKKKKKKRARTEETARGSRTIHRWKEKRGKGPCAASSCSQKRRERDDRDVAAKGRRGLRPRLFQRGREKPDAGYGLKKKKAFTSSVSLKLFPAKTRRSSTNFTKRKKEECST